MKFKYCYNKRYKQFKKIKKGYKKYRHYGYYCDLRDINRILELYQKNWRCIKNYD